LPAKGTSLVISQRVTRNRPSRNPGLKLTPRRNEPDYEYLVVAVDPASLQIRALTTRDHEGGESTLAFTNLKENQGISDKVFAVQDS
jgi:outer membrane lipoprotein-sorting protein